MWHIFTMDEYGKELPNYRTAVNEAQSILGTDKRPTRIHSGFYTLSGENHSMYIATTEGAAQQGFDWAENHDEKTRP